MNKGRGKEREGGVGARKLAQSRSRRALARASGTHGLGSAATSYSCRDDAPARGGRPRLSGPHRLFQTDMTADAQTDSVPRSVRSVTLSRSIKNTPRTHTVLSQSPRTHIHTKHSHTAHTQRPWPSRIAPHALPVRRASHHTDSPLIYRSLSHTHNQHLHIAHRDALARAHVACSVRCTHICPHQGERPRALRLQSPSIVAWTATAFLAERAHPVQRPIGARE